MLPSLPQPTVPEDVIKLISLPKPITIRPYLVGEEKLLLIAQQANDQKEVEKAVKQIINRCTFGAIDAEKLAYFDVEYLFLQLRAKSVSNMLETSLKCKNMVDEKSCDRIVQIQIDINDIKLDTPDGHTNKVQLDDRIGIILKYPTARLMSAELVEALAGCLDTVYTADGTTFEVKDFPPEQIITFVEGLTIGMVDKIKAAFFDTMPRLSYGYDFKCPNCGNSEHIVLEGLADFFD
jgi:hypothetical protein